MFCKATKPNGHQCSNTLYRCGKCGATGCQNIGCPNQLFKHDNCARCGSVARAPL